MLRSIAVAALLTSLVGTAVAAFVVWSGLIDISATKGGGPPDRILAYAAIRSIRHHATDEENPLARDPVALPEALKTGMGHYRTMCLACHGGPGAEPARFAAGLHPSAPDLSSPEVQSFTDGMLYQTIAYGIGSTGMPAFGRALQAKEIWSVVAFVRHLSTLTPAEKQQLRATTSEPSGEGGAGPEQSAPPLHEQTAPVANATDARVHRVSINNMKFDPPALEVAVGDTVEWTNADFVTHTATADDGAFDTGKIEGGQTKRVVMPKKGDFPYFCRFHAPMKGSLKVR